MVNKKNIRKNAYTKNLEKKYNVSLKIIKNLLHQNNQNKIKYFDLLENLKKQTDINKKHIENLHINQMEINSLEFLLDLYGE